jgi:hypothetical protein
MNVGEGEFAMKRCCELRFLIAGLIVAAGILSRLVPHAPNFTAVSALAMFGSFYFANWKYRVAIPLTTLVLSDLVAGFYEPRLMVAVYASTLIPVLFGLVLRRRLRPGRLLLCGGAASIAFYLSTNFAVWAFSSWYSSDWSGLVACYTAALPFFRYTIASDLLFSTALFGTYALAVYARPELVHIGQTVVGVRTSTAA